MEEELFVFRVEWDGEQYVYKLLDGPEADQWKKYGVGDYDFDRVLVRNQTGKVDIENWISIRTDW